MKRFSELHLWLIRVIGVLVPRRLRADWRREWEAELHHHESLLSQWRRGKGELLRHSLGSVRDALWLQPKRWEDEMIQDLRFGVRMLLRHKGLTFVTVLSLAFGIGANTAIFSVVNAVVLRPLPFREPERLVRIWQDKPVAGLRQMPVSAGNVTVWRNQAKSFEGVAAFYQMASVFTGESEPEQVPGARVSVEFFPVLGLQPMLGRNFTPEEDQPGANRVVLLSHSFWQRRFGGDPGVLGRTITMDHKNSATVIGVMPAEVSYPGKSEFWQLLALKDRNRHGMRHLSVIARRKPGVTVAQAEAEVKLIHEGLQKQFPDDYKEWGVEVVALHESVVGNVRRALFVLFGAVGFVLLIACANVANLLLARAAARQKELAVRAALGAGRFRLIRQMLTESALLAALGSAAGLLLAVLGVRTLLALDPPGVPRLAQVGIDGRVLVFTLVATVVVGLLFGLAPALQLSKPDLNRTLKEGAAQAARGRQRFRGQGLRGFLVVTQTALALVLLVGAGLLLKSFIKLRQVELGFDPTHAVSLTIAPAFNRFAEKQRTNEYYRRMIESLAAAPGVTAVGAVTGAPLSGAYMSDAILIAGRPAPEPAEKQRAYLSVISPDYFRAAGTPLKQGRSLTDDDREGSPRVALVNEALARRYFPDANLMGQRISLRGEPDKPYEIVGVVADLKQFGIDKEVQPIFYVSYWQREMAFMNLVVRSTGEPSALIPALRNRIRTVDPYAPIVRVRTLEETVGEAVAQPRFYTLLLTIFSAIALLLAVIGLYGVMSYAVSQRTHEIGIRMAVGAQPGDVLRLFLRQGIALVGIGLALGLGGALALTRVLTSLLFDVRETDPLTFASVALLLAGVALLACWIPARRAAKVDPMIALRHE